LKKENVLKYLVYPEGIDFNSSFSFPNVKQHEMEFSTYLVVFNTS